jgi:SAM-dependent methyltransferase
MGDPQVLTDGQVKAIEALGAKYPGHYMAKFCVDPRRWDLEAEKLADHLDINCETLEILDIGCGFGYFVNVLYGRGCIGLGVDVADYAILEACGILNAPMLAVSVRAMTRLSLPHHTIDDRTFDLITMFGCTLRHGHPATSKDYWGWDDYRFFFADVLSRLRPGGRFVIRPNVMKSPPPEHADLLDVPALDELIGDFAKIVSHSKGQIILIPR